MHHTLNSFHSSHFQTCSRQHLRDQGHACRRLALISKQQFRRFEFLELHQHYLGWDQFCDLFEDEKAHAALPRTFVFLPAAPGPRSIRPRGDDLCCHLLPLFLWTRSEDCSAGGNPPQVSHVGFPFILGQHLRHVPVLRTAHITRGRALRRAGGCRGPGDKLNSTEEQPCRLFTAWHKHTNTLMLPPSPAWETPITVSVGLVANRAGRTCWDML